MDERQPLVRHHVGEVLEVARVRQRVERDDLVRRRREQMADDVRRDEAGAAGDENALAHPSSFVDRVQGPAFDVALDSAQVLADEREDEALDAEHEQDRDAAEERAGEVGLADPVDDAVDAERERRRASRRCRARRRSTGSAAARSPPARAARAASGAAASSATDPCAARARRRPRRRSRRPRGRAPS